MGAQIVSVPSLYGVIGPRGNHVASNVTADVTNRLTIMSVNQVPVGSEQIFIRDISNIEPVTNPHLYNRSLISPNS